MTSIPVYAVTGFLEAGKTTFLNKLMSHYNWKEIDVLVIQFEEGMEEFEEGISNRHFLTFSNTTLINEPTNIVKQIETYVQTHSLKEIWIEWNGMVSISNLQGLLLDSSLRDLCRLEKIIHIADALQLESLLGQTGGALPEQISNCDFAVIRNARSKERVKHIRQILTGMNPGVPVFQSSQYNHITKQIYYKKTSTISSFVQAIILFAVLYFIVYPVAEVTRIPFNLFINIFLGIILQAIPFLLIGVILSSAIQTFIPQKLIERFFPKSTPLGMLIAIIAGFCLPVCDCASIPIFKSLVKKGIPLPVAITFMTATPVINPVVILSTYYAFNGDLTVVLSRICLGIASAVIIGLIFHLSPVKGQVLSGGSLDRFMCSCGCYEEVDSITTWKGKLNLFVRHSQAEFFDVGKYLIIGTCFASLFQVSSAQFFTSASTGANLALSTILMMVMAFALSLCSSSDAIVARSFANQFPMGAIMGFLVFGPMMDIKNIMMLASGFTKRFIGKLVLVTFVTCFVLVFVCYRLGGI